MAVLMIRAGDHPHEPPTTVLVLEGEVKAYEAQGYVRVGTDPGTAPKRARFNGLTFQRGSTGE